MIDAQTETVLEELVARAVMIRDGLQGFIEAAETLTRPRRPANEVETGMEVHRGGAWLRVVSTSLVAPPPDSDTWFVRLEFIDGDGQVYPGEQNVVAREARS